MNATGKVDECVVLAYALQLSYAFPLTLEYPDGLTNPFI